MQEMTYEEREHLKSSIKLLGDDAGEALRMIAHWHRQDKPVAFRRYAAHWSNVNGTPTMKLVWPLSEAPRLEPRVTYWI